MKQESLTTEIELALAGTALAGGLAMVAAIRADVPATAWGDPRAKAVMVACCSAADTGREVDIVTVATILERDSLLVLVGGVPALDDIAARARPAEVASMVDRVLAHARVRAMAESVDKLARAGHTPHAIERPDDYLAAVATLSDSARSQLRSGTVSAKDAAIEAMQSFQDRAKFQPTIPTSILALNDYLDGGFWPESTYIIGARPGVGKSAFMVTEAIHGAGLGHPQLIWDSEMPVKELTGRALVQMSAIDLRQWRRGPNSLTHAEGKSLYAAAGRFAMLPIELECEALEMGSILARSRVWIDTVVEPMRAEDPNLIPMIWIDYIQNYKLEGKWSGPDEMIAEMASRWMKFAQRHKCSVGLIAAANRASAKEQRPPRMSDLRYCGGLEFSAGGVILLHRESGADVNEDPAAGELVEQDGILILDKQRGGRAGVVRATWRGPKGVWEQRKTWGNEGGREARH